MCFGQRIEGVKKKFALKCPPKFVSNLENEFFSAPNEPTTRRVHSTFEGKYLTECDRRALTLEGEFAHSIQPIVTYETLFSKFNIKSVGHFETKSLFIFCVCAFSTCHKAGFEEADPFTCTSVTHTLTTTPTPTP